MGTYVVIIKEKKYWFYTWLTPKLYATRILYNMINLKNAMLPVARYKHTSELLTLKRLIISALTWAFNLSTSVGENAKQQGFLYIGTTTLDN